MYGMVNKTISTTVIQRYGQEKWDQIDQMLDFDTEAFVEMQPYPDEVTFGIVAKSTEVLNVEVSDFLRELGYDWVILTSGGSYGNMYSMVDGGMFGFIKNLNNMHQIIAAQMPELKAPSFLCDQNEAGEILVKYFSEREGLETFVEGLLAGLCHVFDEPSEISIVSIKNADQPFSEFLMTPKRG